MRGARQCGVAVRRMSAIRRRIDHRHFRQLVDSATRQRSIFGGSIDAETPLSGRSVLHLRTDRAHRRGTTGLHQPQEVPALARKVLKIAVGFVSGSAVTVGRTFETSRQLRLRRFDYAIRVMCWQIRLRVSSGLTSDAWWSRRPRNLYPLAEARVAAGGNHSSDLGGHFSVDG